GTPGQSRGRKATGPRSPPRRRPSGQLPTPSGIPRPPSCRAGRRLLSAFTAAARVSILLRGHTMSAENKSLARRAFDELWTKGNLTAIDQLYSENCVFHDLGNPEDIRGRDGIKQFARMFRTAFPDLQCTMEDVLAEGDKVALRW